MKTAPCSINKLIVLALLFTSSIRLSADAYSEAQEQINRNETDKGLTLFYKYLDSGSSDIEKNYNSFVNIIDYEKDIFKIINTVKKHIGKLDKSKKSKSEILLYAAELSELSGRTEEAVEFYITSYNEYPIPENSSSLLFSSRILIDNGEFEKSLKQINFYKNLPLDKNSIYKAELTESLVYILSGKKLKGEEMLSELISAEDISLENLTTALLIAHNYKLSNIIESAEKIIENRDKSVDFQSILSFSSMLSPAAYFNYSEYITNEPDNSIKITKDNPIYIQTGSYSSIKNAEIMISKLKKIGFNGEIRKTKYKGRDIFKVLIPADSKETAQKYHIILKENSIESFLIFN